MMLRQLLRLATAVVVVLLVAACGTVAGPPRTIYLARHGQTAWNRVGRFQGDPDLDQVGYINRVNLWLLLKQEKLTAIYSSEKQRSRRTAELVARQLHLPIKARAALNEIDSGVLAGICVAHMDPKRAEGANRRCQVRARGSRIGVTVKEIQRIWSEVRARGLAGKVPLGESYADMRRRLKPFVHELGEVVRRGQVLVVGHGVINRVLLHLLLGWPMRNVHRLRQENDQVYRIEGIGTRNVKVSLYTPGMGWAECSPPGKDQRFMDCNPGPPRRAANRGGGTPIDKKTPTVPPTPTPPPTTAPAGLR